MEFKTIYSAQTKKIAGLLAEEILADKSKRKNSLALALSGDLGSGKTTFTQGFLRGLGIKNKITSPTFVIAKNYKLKTWNLKLKTQNYKHAWHFDCYRIRKPAELFSLGFKDVLADPRNIVLIEWPEVIKKVLPKNSIWINFKHGEKENKRTINFRNGRLRNFYANLSSH
ncbi:tRNA (adenosine(37)-N6)-threonylcarbamoyltransferase complex ATPase subunit type 1 TsaE [Candidatus Wolfebacteria bacterium]|nr:tRNA (adenosine(37)-N6)-threonylcarbamoyltransferase complex ATPase subunit type 1 TsaE [Candidatus Wolfebacteria bacterium]